MIILLRGGGDLATGMAIRLHRVGLKVIITELPKPLAVRRKVAFSEAVYQGETTVEGVRARLVDGPAQANGVFEREEIPVFVDPQGQLIDILKPTVLIDARMTKHPPKLGIDVAPLIIGLGPGFNAGVNCHAVIETKRGHSLGRVLWSGSAHPDTGVPGEVGEHRSERVLRAPQEGVLKTYVEISHQLEKGQKICEVNDLQVFSPFRGVLRGLLPSGIHVSKGLKIGDVDPRNDQRYCYIISDKSLAIGGGVLEAILSRVDLRPNLWQ